MVCKQAALIVGMNADDRHTYSQSAVYAPMLSGQPAPRSGKMNLYRTPTYDIRKPRLIVFLLVSQTAALQSSFVEMRCTETHRDSLIRLFMDPDQSGYGPVIIRTH